MEEAIEVKHEFGSNNRLQCRTCFSVGRVLRPLGDLTNIFLKITSDCVYPQQNSLETTLVCWQCSSLLKKVIQFKEQVKTADQLLQTNESFIYGPLSNLTSVTLNDTRQTIYIYDEQTNQTIENTENEVEKTPDDYFNDNSNEQISENEIEVKIEEKKQSKSRWALKRAQQNKKPKFKVCTYSDETFKKVRISNEELLQCIKREKDSAYYKSKRWKCYNCVLGFKNKRKLEKHNQNNHSKNKDYICDICKSKVSDKRHLLAHLRKHNFVYKCEFCEFVCRKEMRSWHFEKEHKKVYQCIKCKLKFGSRRVFFQHFKEWHEKYICNYCGVTFKMKFCIKDHIRKQHSPFECKSCCKTFSRYNGLWLHNRLVHRPASPAYCAECDIHYADTYRLKWHLCNSVKHAPRNKLRIPCTACDKIFTKKIYMKDHYNLVHLKLFKYRCETCNKNFIRNADLVKHTRKIHEGILPPKNKICYICGRGFTTNKILQNHVRTHTGSRPFACECTARFTQRAALLAHMRTHSHVEGT